MLSNYFDRIVGRGTFCETGLAGLRPTDAGLSIDAPLYCVKKKIQLPWQVRAFLRVIIIFQAMVTQ